MKHNRRRIEKLFQEGERIVIKETETPKTRESLAQDLLNLGVTAGMTLEVHSSLSSLGWVCGGPVAVVQALMDVVTEAGTLLMPTQTYQCCDPQNWCQPSVPKEWWPTLRDHLPAFDPQVTPAQLMGQIVETFRTWPGVIRSTHPRVSFAAWGKHAHAITAEHSLDYGLGEQSPLAKLYALDGYVLLLGVGYDRCAALHLAEYRARNPKQITERSPLLENGQRIWKTYVDRELDSNPFKDIMCDLRSEENEIERTELVGDAIARLFPMRPSVDFAVTWIEQWYDTHQGK